MAESKEIRITGRAVSRGAGIGRAVCLFGARRQFFRRKLDPAQLDAEISRFHTAISDAQDAISADIKRAQSGASAHVADLLESHLLILNDPLLRSKISDAIAGQHVNAEWAIQEVFSGYSASLRQNDDIHLREKSLDIEDVGERLICAIGTTIDPVDFEAGAVVAASELRASTILRIRDRGIAAIATEHGGWTSHASILAREFGIPAVTGLRRLFSHVRDGVTIAVDGYKGIVIIEPSAASIEELQNNSGRSYSVPADPIGSVGSEIVTLDGQKVTFRTNTISAESLRHAEKAGAAGIGLYRSESLVGKYGRLPTEDEQTREYTDIAAAAGSGGVCIRTFDIDGDLIPETALGRQKNPALGLRAIRLVFRDRNILIPQVRAILRAAHRNNISVVVPMVTGVAEIVEFRSVIEDAKAGLIAAKVSFGSPSIGAMIEVPSAAIISDQLAEAADFLCLGTNDLAQYLLAADRDNESVSEWFRTLHPAMLRIVRIVIESCKAAKKRLTICGEMAGSPFYVPVLIGLGAREISISPGSVGAVRRVVCGIAFEEASALAIEALKLTTPEDVESLVSETARTKWPHLYPPGFFD